MFGEEPFGGQGGTRSDCALLSIASSKYVTGSTKSSFFGFFPLFRVQ